MKRSDRPMAEDWVSRQLRGNAGTEPAIPFDRRSREERRRRVWWSVLYGSFNPRRRRPPRRLNDTRFHTLDWHRAHLFAVALGILMLNVADAFLTVTLLSAGAIEVNPILVMVFDHHPAMFAALKMAITGISVLTLVALAYHRFMRVVRVELMLYAILVAYMILIGHELEMLRRLSGSHAY